MTAKHKEAVPANPIIRENYPVLSPKEAQQLYPDIIVDNKDFICAAYKECTAPLTCRCLDKKNKTAAFVEGSQKENKHHPKCVFSDENEEDASPEVDYQHREKKFLDIFSGEDVLYLYGDTYRDGKKSNGGTNGIREGGLSGTQIVTTSPENTDSLPTRKKQNRFETLRKQVVLFELDPEHKVIDRMTGNTIKINKIFIPIKSNDLSSKIKSRRTLIYYGSAFINEPKSEGKDFNIRFSETLELDDVKGKPTFFVDKETLYEKFPVVMEKWKDNKNMLVNVYIRAHFSINNGYINFDIDKEILHKQFFVTLRK